MKRYIIFASKALCFLSVLLLLVSSVGCGKREAPFSQTMERRDPAYIDIVSITPAYTTGSLSYATGVVCSCVTTQGETVWVDMLIEEYYKNFDADAKIGGSLLASDDAGTYLINARVYGMAWPADQVASGLSEKIGCSMLLNFESVSIADFEKSTSSAIAPAGVCPEM